MLVNNLASKLTRTLFPTGMSFFRISDTDKMREIIAQLGSENAQLSAVFTGIEREAMTLLTTHAGFAQLTHLMKLLIITGNALLYRDPLTGRMTVYSVRDYVVRLRAPEPQYRTSHVPCDYALCQGTTSGLGAHPSQAGRVRVQAQVLQGETWDSIVVKVRRKKHAAKLRRKRNSSKLNRLECVRLTHFKLTKLLTT
ncbi:head to tail connecting protein [Vibrio phage vB_VpP_AC2]|uniref:Head to tail connecting protein n=1 Tax=Vibrio phage vB_VpP_AC2 TaxID=2961842 RepID=A0A9E7NJ43_9CAUD|nr:head to tail connecting protein [Vibrio phage vB_VpP_AC2]